MTVEGKGKKKNIYPHEITKHQTAKQLVAFTDKMVIAPIEEACKLHARYSKIAISILDYSRGGGDKTVITEVNVDPITMKLLYEKVQSIKHQPNAGSTGGSSSSELKIGLGSYKELTPSEALNKYGEKAKASLNGLIPILEKNAEKYKINGRKINQINSAIRKFDEGSLTVSEQPLQNKETLLSETKIIPFDQHKNEKGEYPTTQLNVEYNPNMDNCWTISIENGWAEKQTYANGGMAIKRGSYRKERENKIVVPEEKFREMVRQTNDFILLKEQLFMNRLQRELIENPPY